MNMTQLRTMHLEPEFEAAFKHTSFIHVLKGHYATRKKNLPKANSGRLWEERGYMLDLLSTANSNTRLNLRIDDGSKMSVDGYLKLCRTLVEAIENQKIPEASKMTEVADTHAERMIALWLTEQWPALLKPLKKTAKRLKKIRWELQKEAV